MRVKTAELGFRADDVRGSAAQARDLGPFRGRGVERAGLRWVSPVPAEVVISVPLEALDAALAEWRGSGRRITTDSVRGEDVTEEFVAREPHERNLLSVEESPLKLYERAESVNDTLEIEQELTEVWGQIEQVQGRIRYPERRTASSDIILHLEPVATATPEPPWDPYLVAARDASLLVPQAACDHGDDLRRRLLLAARPGAFGGPRWLAVKPRTGPHRGPRLIPNIVDHRLVFGHASVRNGPRPARFRVRVKLFRTRPG
jgi:hypothetical protein